MRFLLTFFCIFFLFQSSVKGNAFSEIFGSEGASGINNSKIRSLSYTFQYFTLVGSIGYVAKQLYNSGFMEPIGLLPSTISNLSSLAYGDDFIVNNHTANVYSVTENVEQINMINEYKKRLSVNKFSSQSIILTPALFIKTSMSTPPIPEILSLNLVIELASLTSTKTTLSSPTSPVASSTEMTFIDDFASPRSCFALFPISYLQSTRFRII